MESACSRLASVSPAEVERWRAAGTKSSFFAELQAATAPFNLTGVARWEPSSAHRIHPSDSYVSDGDQTRIVVLGDSIAREASQALYRLFTPHGNVTYAILNSPTNLGAPSQSPQGSLFQKAAHHALGEELLRDLEGCRVDALFLGGYVRVCRVARDLAPISASRIIATRLPILASPNAKRLLGTAPPRMRAHGAI